NLLVFFLSSIRGLRSIPSLSRFHRLRYLWINNNKIQDLTFLIKNCCLTELYLHNNELTDISGALKHLRALQILLLHNNQLKKLGETVKELKGMLSLQTLNLFHNPLAQEQDYRLHVIHVLPSVQLLDRKPVAQKERESAFHLCNHERSCLVQSIAFGKRVNTPLGATVGSRRYSQPARRLMMPSVWKHSDNVHSLCSFCRVPFESPEDAVLLRAMTRSLMEFSFVDWNKVATCQERGLENRAEEPHEKLTIQFR
ncbi:LRC72 protein, partial [Brachypteracias leptosomus]|nr:LRC72 protein [Brachypteracias leptosomus]